MKEMKKYDGMTIINDSGIKTVFYDITEALNIKDPRNVFLNGQLFIELQCDGILTEYFCKGETGYDNRRRSLFSNFLKSKEMSYYTKIKLLKELEILENNQMKKIIDKKIYTSLKAIGAVRNAFQHNLEYEEALKSLTGDKFVFLLENKKLSDYEDVEQLRYDFTVETSSLYSSLHDLAFKI
jgi:hypothetical protein